MSKGISSKQIKLRMLLLHSLTFSLYIVSVVVFYVYFSVYYINYKAQQDLTQMLVAWMLCSICSFAAEVCIAFILWGFMENHQQPKPAKSRKLR